MSYVNITANSANIHSSMNRTQSAASLEGVFQKEEPLNSFTILNPIQKIIYIAKNFLDFEEENTRLLKEGLANCDGEQITINKFILDNGNVESVKKILGHMYCLEKKQCTVDFVLKIFLCSRFSYLEGRNNVSVQLLKNTVDNLC